MQAGTKIYFASDVHLGIPDYESSLLREKHFVKWLDSIKKDASEIYLLGDIFDFWFEYKTSVPHGYIRLLGKITEITDSGIPVYFFTGNHDMWIFDYLPRETGITIYRQSINKIINDIKFYIGHGDGLGTGDIRYKMLKKVFANKLSQWLFARLHPNLGIGIARFWSLQSRLKHDLVFKGEEKERLYHFCKTFIEKEHYDYFIFGHRHIPLDLKIGEKSRYINTGDWINHFSYAVFDGKEVELKYFTLIDNT